MPPWSEATPAIGMLRYGYECGVLRTAPAISVSPLNWGPPGRRPPSFRLPRPCGEGDARNWEEEPVVALEAAVADCMDLRKRV